MPSQVIGMAFFIRQTTALMASGLAVVRRMKNNLDGASDISI